MPSSYVNRWIRQCPHSSVGSTCSLMAREVMLLERLPVTWQSRQSLPPTMLNRPLALPLRTPLALKGRSGTCTVLLVISRLPSSSSSGHFLLPIHVFERQPTSNRNMQG